MCWSVDANDPRAARAARKAAAQLLRCHTRDENALSAAELVIGELLSNTVRHANGKCCLELGVADGNLQISVHDTSSKFMLDMRRPIDQFSENGRGLYIISELASKVAVIPHDGPGKRVTVTLDVKAEPSCPLEPRIGTLDPSDAANAVCLRPQRAHFVPAA